MLPRAYINSFVGSFYIPSLSDGMGISNAFFGDGDPMSRPPSFFSPPAKPGDTYTQTDLMPNVLWIMNDSGVWIPTSIYYDVVPPDDTDCDLLNNWI